MRLFRKKGTAGMLEGFDVSLIEQVKRDNAEFCRLLEEHEQYEQHETDVVGSLLHTSDKRRPESDAQRLPI